ncbi:MAG: helix-turn-helix domain-containing protein [Ruminococcaceae bacterium]|nr:helix-turn-helix domain-containing protein [Oscillospiraceae bacterium]
MTVFGYTLRFLRKKNNLTLDALSEALGIGEMTLANIENGYIQPEEETAGRLADFFGVTVHYMKGCVELTVTDAETDAAHTPRRFVRLRPIPMSFSESEAEARQVLPEQEIILPLPAGDRSEYIAVQVTDNSMLRYRVMAGDTLVVRQDPLRIRNGDLVLLISDAGHTILRRYFREGSTVLLRSDAEDLLPPIRLADCDKTCRLIGTVVQIRIDVTGAFAHRRAQNPPELPEEILPPPDMEKQEGSGSMAAFMHDYGFGEN